MSLKCYSELRRIETFEERFRYLSLKGSVGRSTFGFDRWINQQFYATRAWNQTRQRVIARDLGCDLGIEGHDIYNRLLIHHMNPITPEDIIHGDESLINPEFLITTCHQTHNAIHYGDETLLARPFVERKPGDTKLW